MLLPAVAGRRPGATSVDVALTDSCRRVLDHRAEPSDVRTDPRPFWAGHGAVRRAARRRCRGRYWASASACRAPWSSGRAGPSPRRSCRVGTPTPSASASRSASTPRSGSTTTSTSWSLGSGAGARGHDNVVFVKIGTGIGAGLISDGVLHRGAQGSGRRRPHPGGRRPGGGLSLRLRGLPRGDGRRRGAGSAREAGAPRARSSPPHSRGGKGGPDVAEAAAAGRRPEHRAAPALRSPGGRDARRGGEPLQPVADRDRRRRRRGRGRAARLAPGGRLRTLTAPGDSRADGQDRPRSAATPGSSVPPSWWPTSSSRRTGSRGGEPDRRARRAVGGVVT